MKRYILVVVFVMSFTGLFSREVFNINRGWKFFSNSEVTSDGALKVNLPHIWNNDALSGKKDYFRGIGNYIKTIEIPADWSGKRVFIKLYGANTVTNVFVNSKHVGEHRGGYTAFAYDITPFVRFGERNYLWLMVNNSPQMDVLPTAGDANSYGGVFRDVELIVTNPVVVSLTDYASDGFYVAQHSVSSEAASGEAVVKVNGLKDSNIQALMTVFTDKMDTVSHKDVRARLNGKQTTTLNIPYNIDNPILWNGTINPYLYNVGVKILCDGVVSDSVVIKTGFRYFSVDPINGFMLNGMPYKLKGVIVHQDRAMTGPAMTPYQIVEDLDKICSMGANAVRVANASHHPDFYALCDRVGILVWSDMPFVGSAYLTDKAFLDTHAFRNNCKEQMMEVIRQQFNHPSVFLWGLFSEVSMRGDNPVDFIVELNGDVKREDPSRLTVATSNEDGDINFITDLIVWNHHFGWKEGLPADITIWLEQLHKNWGKLRSGLSYGAGASIYHQQDSLYRPVYNGNWHPERWQTHLHEEYFKLAQSDSLLWGCFVANLFDYGAAGRSWGEGNGLNDYGLVTFDRKYCKDAYYLYRANWYKNEPFVYITEKRWFNRKNKLQDIRVYSNCVEVELLINGVSHGAVRGEKGIFVWKGVLFNEGVNNVEARTKTTSDKTLIEIQNSNSKSFIN